MIRFFQPHHRAYRLSYATGEEVTAGKTDPREPLVLLGDPAVFTTVERTCNRYTQPHAAGVLSFEEDLPDEKARQLVEEFYDVVLPGRIDGQYLFCCIRHHEKSRRQQHRTGLHWFALNTDLILNQKVDFCWGPRDGRRVECWQEFACLRDGYASPKDPARSRALNFRAWPESPTSAEAIAQFASRMGNVKLDGHHLEEEIACGLMLSGAQHLAFDRTRKGRLRAKFSSRPPGGEPIQLSLIVAPEKHVDPLRRSFLRGILGPTGFRRTPQVFELLRTQLSREIEFAALRQDQRHGLDADRLTATLRSVEKAQLYQPELLTRVDETGMGFPRFDFPEEVLAGKADPIPLAQVQPGRGISSNGAGIGIREYHATPLHPPKTYPHSPNRLVGG